MFPQLICVLLLMTSVAHAQPLRVGVAISLRDAMTTIGHGFEKQTNQRVEFIFGSSGQILAQIVNGAPIDVFISAAAAQVDELERAKLVQPGTRRIVAENAIVLVVPSSVSASILSFQDLTSHGVGRIAIGEPTTVPAGQYAMQVLAKLNLLDSVRSRLVYGANVRQVLSYIERGEVIAGIIYSTDAKEAGDRVRVVTTASPNLHDLVIYPAVIIRSSNRQEAARRFLNYLSSEPAKRLLSEKGFSTPSTSTTKPAE